MAQIKTLLRVSQMIYYVYPVSKELQNFAFSSSGSVDLAIPNILGLKKNTCNPFPGVSRENFHDAAAKSTHFPEQMGTPMRHLIWLKRDRGCDGVIRICGKK